MTDWNQRYADNDTPWDKGTAAPPLEELLDEPASASWFKQGPILVPGCGTGHDVRLIARRTQAKVIGLDIAPLAIEQAQRHARIGSENYQLASWFDYQLPTQQKAAAIWEHTCFCAIHPSQRPDYAKAVRRLLAPEGHFFGVFFLETGSDQGPPWPSQLGEIKALFSQDLELIYEKAPERTYPGRENCEILLGWKKPHP